MKDLKKIIGLFILCLILAVYCAWSGTIPNHIGISTSPTNTTAPDNNVLGAQTSQPSFGPLVNK